MASLLVSSNSDGRRMLVRVEKLCLNCWRKFWEVEEILATATKVEQAVFNFWDEKKTKRNEDGLFLVVTIFKPTPKLGDSLS